MKIKRGERCAPESQVCPFANERGRKRGGKKLTVRERINLSENARARAGSADYFAIAKPPLTSFAIATDTNN